MNEARIAAWWASARGSAAVRVFRCQASTAIAAYIHWVANREAFFTFNWLYLVGLICFIAGAWLSEGPVFVVVVCAIGVAITGVYYLVWRWRQDRTARPR